MILATTDGSDSCEIDVSTLFKIRREGVLTVEISPKLSSSPDRIFRRIRLMILPLRVLGRSSTAYTALGAANGPIDLRTWRMSSLRMASVSPLPALSETNALTAWPVSSSWIPTTAASATASAKISRYPLIFCAVHDLPCSIKAASISAVERRWPETLTTSSTRPLIQ